MKLEELKELCFEYDIRSGNWPESEYEGFALLQFFCRQKSLPFPDKDEWAQEVEKKQDELEEK